LLPEDIKFGPSDWSDTAGGSSWAALPGTHDVNGQKNSKNQSRKGHDPSYAIEACRRGCCKNSGPVFLHKTLQREIVTVASINGGCEFTPHAIGIGASDVVTFQQNLTAAARAHELVAQIVEAATIVASPHKREQSKN
jgi:hypothetical protein